MVGTVRKMLALEGDGIVVVIDSAALSGRAAVQPVSCIYLNTRLGSEYPEYAAACPGTQFCRFLKLSGHIFVNRPAGIIALAVFECREVFLDVAAECLGLEKVHRSSLDRLGVAERNQGAVGRKIF